jgi:hypothetical protein
LIDYYGVNTAPLQFRGQGKPGRSRADYKNLIFGSDIEHETPSSFFGETVLWSYNKGPRHVAAAITASVLCPQRQASSASSSHDRARAFFFHDCRRAAIDYKSFATTSNFDFRSMMEL